MSTAHFIFETGTEQKRTSWKEVWKELIAIIDITWFMFVSCILYYIMIPVSLIFVGSLGTVYLDAVGLGNTLFNVFGILAINGVTTGADTTMSQSFGTRNKKMVGVYLQKGLIIHTVLVSMVCVAILVNAGALLILSGQDREISRLGGIYTTILSISTPIYAFWDIMTRFYRVQNIMWSTFVSLAIMVCSVISLHYLFITILGMGIEGSALAQVLTYSIGALFVLIITPFQKKVLDITWGGFTRKAWFDWGTFSSLSFVGVFTLGLQWWAMEICTLLSGQLGQAELAAQAIIFQVNYFIYLVPLAIGISCNILIGQHVGANKPERGKLCMRIAWVLTWVISLAAIILLLSIRDLIPSIFSPDERVITLTSETIPYLAVFHVFDSTVASSLGMCRGVARQKMGAVVSFIGIYLIGLPSAIIFTFYFEMGLKGLWLGPALGLAFETVALLFLSWRTDWTEECRAAQIRAGLNPNLEEADDSSEHDESTELLKNHADKLTKRYQNELTSSQKDLSVLRRGKSLPTKQLVFRRGLAVSGCMVVFLLGLLLHFNLESDYPLVALSNSSYVNRSLVHSTLS